MSVTDASFAQEAIIEPDGREKLHRTQKAFMNHLISTSRNFKRAFNLATSARCSFFARAAVAARPLTAPLHLKRQGATIALVGAAAPPLEGTRRNRIRWATNDVSVARMERPEYCEKNAEWILALLR